MELEWKYYITESNILYYHFQTISKFFLLNVQLFLTVTVIFCLKKLKNVNEYSLMEEEEKQYIIISINNIFFRPLQWIIIEISIKKLILTV